MALGLRTNITRIGTVPSIPAQVGSPGVAWAQCYNTFYARNLQVFLKSCNCIYPWKSFPALFNVCEKAGAYPEWSNFQVLHSRVGSLPYSQILDKAEKVCQG